MYKVLYFHEGTQFGGAEKSLLNLVKGIGPDKPLCRFAVSNEGQFTNSLKKLKIEYTTVGFPSIRRFEFLNGCIKELIIFIFLYWQADCLF